MFFVLGMADRKPFVWEGLGTESTAWVKRLTFHKSARQTLQLSQSPTRSPSSMASSHPPYIKGHGVKGHPGNILVLAVAEDSKILASGGTRTSALRRRRSICRRLRRDPCLEY
jgi:hypothetical protein